MLIIGAKGLAKEILEIFHQLDQLDNLCFFDNISVNIPMRLFGRFPVLRNIDEVIGLFDIDNRFTIGVGNPLLRLQMAEKFNAVGGELVSTISPRAIIGHYGTRIENGCNIMAGVVITNDVIISRGCLINPNCTISHDSVIGEFSEISPGVNIAGHCNIGCNCFIGTNATVLPKISIGDSVIVGAASVVTKNVAENLTVVGNPAKPLTNDIN